MNHDELESVYLTLGQKKRKDKINIRVIMPYSEYYNTLISVVSRFGLVNFLTVNIEDYIKVSKKLLTKIWRSELEAPTKSFYKWVTQTEYDT